MTQPDLATIERDLAVLRAEQERDVALATIALETARQLGKPTADAEAALADARAKHVGAIAELEAQLAAGSAPAAPTHASPAAPKAPHPVAQQPPPKTPTPPDPVPPPGPALRVAGRGTMLIGALVIAGFGRILLTAITTTQWTPVPGEVVTSSWSPRSTDVSIGSANFAYRYTVAGTDYVSDVVQWTASGGSGLGIAAGSEVEVYVNPDDPTQAVLVPGPDTWTYVQTGFGLAILALGGWLLTLSRRDDVVPEGQSQ